MITRKFVKFAALALAVVASASLLAKPSAAQAAQEQKPSYTIPEYNAFQAAQNEKDLAAKIKLLDDFVAKFPNSTLSGRERLYT